MLLSALVLTAALAPQAPPPPAPTESTPAAVASTPAEPTPAVKTTDLGSTGLAQGSIDAGLVAYRKRRFAAAASEFEKAVAADPSSAAAHYYLGYCDLQAGRAASGRDSPGKRVAARGVREGVLPGPDLPADLGCREEVGATRPARRATRRASAR